MQLRAKRAENFYPGGGDKSSVVIMDLWEHYGLICSTAEWSTTDPSVVLHSGALQNSKYLNMSTTDRYVVLQNGVLQIHL